MKTTTERVNYAARVIREGRPTSRKFDGCLEEGDANEVVLGLVRRAEKCPRLHENLPRYIAQSSIDKFTVSPPEPDGWYEEEETEKPATPQPTMHGTGPLDWRMRNY